LSESVNFFLRGVFFKAWAGQQRRRQNSKYIKVLTGWADFIGQNPWSEWNEAERKGKAKKAFACVACLHCFAVFS
jgi:hypothetical protein